MRWTACVCLNQRARWYGLRVYGGAVADAAAVPLAAVLLYYVCGVDAVVSFVQEHRNVVLSTELILENYHQMFCDLGRRVQQLQSSIRAKQEIINTQARTQ